MLGPMTETTIGLRERKKARTRQVIADAAARLFAERGYERVSVAEVARAAEVSEQTVYNYFQTKEALVTDRDEPLQAELCRRIRERDPDSTAAAAIRPLALDSVEGIARVPVDQWRGELGYLAAISPTVQRLALEMSARQADALAAAIVDTADVSPELAQLQAIALVGVFQIIVREAGQRTVDGQDQEQIATELRPAIDAILGELDRWFSRDPEATG
jgi:AcrR family transcriptional regulator